MGNGQSGADGSVSTRKGVSYDASGAVVSCLFCRIASKTEVCLCAFVLVCLCLSFCVFVGFTVSLRMCISACLCP